MEKIVCSACGAASVGKKFCPACGEFLTGASTQKKTAETLVPQQVIDATNLPLVAAVSEPGITPAQVKNTSVSDAGLKLLIDSCKTTSATMGGDGYTEYILYQRAENIYELHYYSKYEYMKEEVHFAYQSDRSIVEAAYKRIDELKLDSFEHYKGFGMTGGQRSLKYVRGTKVIQLTLDNLPMEKQSLLYEIEAIMKKTATDENKLD